MKKELENALYEKYPKVFAEKDLDKTRTCMCWGICCGDGWYTLLDELCGFLQHYSDRKDRSQVVAKQVKEKFGGLRFYVNTVDPFVRGAIMFAEKMSLSICEACGSMEGVDQRGKAWVRTRCQECVDADAEKN